MKILCICHGGNVRSVALKHALNSAGHDAIACGLSENSPETVAHLMDWADRVFLMVPGHNIPLPPSNADKVRIADVGDDIWGSSTHPELKAKVRGLIHNNLLKF